MPATRSDATGAALRIALAFAASLTLAEAADLQLTFIAPLTATALAAQPGPSLKAAVAVPLVAWGLITLVAILVELLGTSAAPAFLVVTVAGLAAGFALSTRRGAPNVVGLLLLIFFTIGPLRLLGHPDAAEIAVNDIARNVLVGAATAWVVGLVLPAPRADDGPLYAPLPPLTAAVATALGAWLVWVYDPPAPGAVLIGIIIALRADRSGPATVGRDRVGAALVGGAAAVVAVSLVSLAPTLPVLVLTLLALAWPLALRVAEADAWQGMALKSLNALAILVAENYSPLFEDAEERLFIRIAGVFIGLAFAAAALVILHRGPRPAGTLHERASS